MTFPFYLKNKEKRKDNLEQLEIQIENTKLIPLPKKEKELENESNYEEIQII